MLLFVAQHNPNYLNRLTVSFNYIIDILRRKLDLLHVHVYVLAFSHQYHRNLLLTQFSVAIHCKGYFRFDPFLNLLIINTGSHYCHLTGNENSEISKSYVNFLYLKFLTCYFK